MDGRRSVLTGTHSCTCKKMKGRDQSSAILGGSRCLRGASNPSSSGGQWWSGVPGHKGEKERSSWRKGGEQLTVTA